MKKLILFLALSAISIFGFSQKIGIKLPIKQNIEFIPAQPAVSILADTVGVDRIIDDGKSVSVNIQIGGEVHGKSRTLTLWSGDDYKKNENWTNEMVIKRIRELLHIQ